ncbi:UNVERIFIED_CONTAM: hypothetical protein K2H54_014761, partial [Gekko kuhli]
MATSPKPEQLPPSLAWRIFLPKLATAFEVSSEENDIFLGWEKGAYKKWGKSKKKCSDLTLEEMKKQAAVQCLRSASDESSGIETLVEELCCRLKDLQSKQEEKIQKKLEGSLPPEVDLSPAAKDQVE